MRIGEVIEEDLKFFKNLTSIDLSDNLIKINEVYNLQALVELNLMCNKINIIPEIPEHAFRHLEVMNLSFNKIPAANISNLAAIPRLSTLDLSSNDLYTLPDNLEKFTSLKELILSGNALSTDSVMFSASKIFYSLSTVPNL